MGIGKRLREARDAKNLSQKELADMVGVTSNAISNYETEISHPKEQIMYKLLDALGIDANFLFQDCYRTTAKSSLGLSKADRAMLDLYHQLNRQGQEKLEDYACLLISSGEFKHEEKKEKRA